MRLRIINRRFSDSDGEYDFESGDFVEARVEYVNDSETGHDSEREIEESLEVGNSSRDSEQEVADMLQVTEEEAENSQPREGSPDESFKTADGDDAVPANAGESSSREDARLTVPTMDEAYSLGWQSGLRTAIAVLTTLKAELSDQDGMEMLIGTGVTRAIAEVSNLLTDRPPVVNLPPPAPVSDEFDVRSARVADAVVREKRKQQKRRYRANKAARLHNAEELLAEVAAEVAAMKSDSDEEPAVAIRAMKPQREKSNKEEYRPTWVYDAKIVKGGKQPARGKQEAMVLAVELDIAGLKCYTLFDSGSTTNAISPDVAVLSKVPLVELAEPMTLQLGTIGSKSTIHYGAHATAGIGSDSFELYYDVANIDYYDAIMGTPFLVQHKVILDFGAHAVTIDGKTFPALTLEKEKLVRRQRRTFRRQVDEAVLYAKDLPPSKGSRKTAKKVDRPAAASIDELLASDVAAPPTAFSPSVSPRPPRVFGNRNVTVEEVDEED